MAAATPTGSATMVVTNMIMVVPTQADRMPARSALREGNCVRKSQPKREAPSRTRSTNSSASSPRQLSRISSPTTTKTLSRFLRHARPARISSSDVTAAISVGLAELAGQEEPEHVEDERHQHQHEARREDALVTDAVVRQVAQAHLHDVRRDRRGR